MSVNYAEGVQGQVAVQTLDRLALPIDGQVHFNDVFPATSGGESWWQAADFDSELTVEVETTGQFPDMKQVPIGERAWVTDYGFVLVDDLVRARAERVATLLDSVHGNVDALHVDDQAEVAAASNPVLALGNYAPRDDKNTEGGKNGSDFFLAITDAGTEYVTTPLGFLSGLEARDRIVALYRIPTSGHPAFDGDHEQFRSARVGRTRRTPGHLVPIFEYESREELIAAKAEGTHPEAIPVDSRTGHIAFVDKFGNVRIEVQDVAKARALKVGQFATLLVKDQGETHEVDVVGAADLKSAPLGQLAVYVNCADQSQIAADNRVGSAVGYLELIARVDDNPSLSKDTAVRQLLQRIPNLDFATAELELVVRDRD